MNTKVKALIIILVGIIYFGFLSPYLFSTLDILQNMIGVIIGILYGYLLNKHTFN